MTRRRLAFCAGLAAAFAAAPVAAQPAFTTLFDGASLDGWTQLGGAEWVLADGVVAAEAGTAGYLVSDASYGDFELRVEFWVSPEANSGIFIRCANRTEITATTCYEVNIFDNRPDPTYGTGGIVGLAAVSSMPKAGGRWNTMEIVARGDAFSVTLNGVKTVDGARDAARAEGPFALQYGTGVVKFRKVEIRPL